MDLKDALKEGPGTSGKMSKARQYLYDVWWALDEAQKSVVDNPNGLEWFKGIDRSRAAMEKLDGIWGNAGIHGGEIVMKHWPGIRMGLVEIEAELRCASLPAASEACTENS